MKTSHVPLMRWSPCRCHRLKSSIVWIHIRWIRRGWDGRERLHCQMNSLLRYALPPSFIIWTWKRIRKRNWNQLSRNPWLWLKTFSQVSATHFGIYYKLFIKCSCLIQSAFIIVVIIIIVIIFYYDYYYPNNHYYCYFFLKWLFLLSLLLETDRNRFMHIRP